MSPSGGSSPFCSSASTSDRRSGRSHASNFLPTRQSCGDGSEVSASPPTMLATSFHVATSRLCTSSGGLWCDQPVEVEVLQARRHRVTHRTEYRYSDTVNSSY